MKKRNTIITITLILILSVAFAQKSKKEETIRIKTSAVCQQCKDRIEQGMAFEKGVKDVTLNLETKEATIRYNPVRTTPENLRKAISKLGYDADDVAADPEAYKKLPVCCKKDTPPH